MFLTQPLAVVAIHDGHVLRDNDGGIATVLQQIRLQSSQLLPVQWGEQLGQLWQHYRRALRATV